MCVLHVKSKTDSFAEFVKQTTLPVYSCHEKGEERFKGKCPPCDHYGFSCDVSTREWDDFSAQVADAIAFLKKHIDELKRLEQLLRIDDIRLDFPIESRLIAKELFSQCDYLPPELISLAAQIGMGIELSQYWPHEDEDNSEHANPGRRPKGRS